MCSQSAGAEGTKDGGGPSISGWLGRHRPWDGGAQGIMATVAGEGQRQVGVPGGRMVTWKVSRGWGGAE